MFRKFKGGQMKKCNYPDCFNCKHDDCDMENADIKKMDAQAEVPICNKCEHCKIVEKERGGVHGRICTQKMKMIKQSVTTSPFWCDKRTDGNILDYINSNNILRGDICPMCNGENQLVRDTRIINGHRVRRRICINCDTRWNTVEIFYSYGKSKNIVEGKET